MELSCRLSASAEGAMGLEVFLIATAVILFGGMFFGLLLSYRDAEAGRAQTAWREARRAEPSAFFGSRASDPALVEQLMLRRLEHHLRRELEAAEQFVEDPRPETLRAGCQSRLERKS